METLPRPPLASWLARVHHDLVRRLVWPARDRRDMGGTIIPGELRPRLVDDEGRPVTAQALWQFLRHEAPALASPPALEAFQRALDEASAAADRDDVDGVLVLETAFAILARALMAPGE